MEIKLWSESVVNYDDLKCIWKTDYPQNFKKS